MKYYAKRTAPATYGMPERVTVTRFSSKSARDWYVKHGETYDYCDRTHPYCEPITAKQARALAMVDNFGDRYIYDYSAGVVYPYGTPGHDAYTLDCFRRAPHTIPTAQDIEDLARLDMELLHTVREAIADSPSQYAPAARERIDTVFMLDYMQTR